MIKRYVKYDASGNIFMVSSGPQTNQSRYDLKEKSPICPEYNGILLGHDDKNGNWICGHMHVKHANADGTVELE